ncbi:MAG: hypothetical protein KAR32_08660 [Candidatus Omnitrophica bacterium]|nr:hypothetical protein [Candidatus Omnitrophota bacterium]
MMVQHRELASGRWAELSLSEQMANIGSEVSRALNWRKKGNDEYSRKAVCRALELISLTVNSADRFPLIREMTRLREALLDYFFGENQFQSSESLWRKYFDHWIG